MSLRTVTERESKSARLVEELEEQLNSSFDSHQLAHNRFSTIQTESVSARKEMERELEEQRTKTSTLEVIAPNIPSFFRSRTDFRQQQLVILKRQSMASNSSNNNSESLWPEAIVLNRSGSPRLPPAPNVLPTPPPSIPLPRLPGSSDPITATPSMPNGLERARSPLQRATSPGLGPSPPGSQHASKDVDPALSQLVEEQEARIRTIEKHLFAEKQLTATLEEALVDLETTSNRTKAEMDGWRKRLSLIHI